jgi:hypothetical protein
MTQRRFHSAIKAMGLAVAALLIVTACTVLPPGMFAVEPTGAPSPTPATVCNTGETLGETVAVLVDTELEDIGVLGLLLAVDITLEQTRQFGAAVGEQYRPLVDDLTGSLQSLQTTLQAMGDQETLGAEVAAIGEAIAEIGHAMDALAEQVRTPCPSSSPDASSAPA